MNHAATRSEAALDPRLDPGRVVRAPRGNTLSCKNWVAEAAYRMIQNNLDQDVAENPLDLVVYGGIGRAARDWACFGQILTALKELEEDESLLIQSGKPVGVFKTHPDAPRVLLANSNLVPKWATWEHFNELDRKGLFMYGQMTAGSWIYIGSQGIVRGAFETFVEAGRQHYANDLTGRWILTAGLGGMGGAQPLAATLAGACSLTIECQQSGIDFRLRTRYVDKQARNIDDALALIEHHTGRKEAVSIALLGNTAGGASWVSLHHGGGIGMGYSQHAGMVIVADGTEAAERRLARVLINDCASGVMRHADAGYDLAIETARKHGLKLPMIGR